VGEQPIIQPGKSFDYVSGCPLNTPSGAMVGHFAFAGERNQLLEIAIPRFALSAPTVRP
jgi:ApaG protein